jgi:DNA-binding XRE family transcriptional regulator
VLVVNAEHQTGARLKKWREEKGWSQSRAAQEVGSKQRTWADWESERLVPSVKLASAIERLTDGYVRVIDWAEVEPARRSRDESGTDVAAEAEKAG